MEVNEMVKFEESIREKIYSIRGFQVMLDRDLAELYEVETKYLNRVMKRNLLRFPPSYCFQISGDEIELIQNEIQTRNEPRNCLRCQIVTSKRGGRQYKPYAFTEQGVAMLSAVLRSDTAIEISIKIIDTFIQMRRFIQTNAQVFQRLDIIESNQSGMSLKLIETDKRIDKIFTLMESGEIKPKQGIYYENQTYDAYNFVSDIFRRADKSIVVIDNYVDDSVLTILSKRKSGVKASIYTKNISAQLKLDVKKFNEQYEPVEVLEFDNSHDRFIIIDEKIIYHFGASLKDLGKKWFGFSKMEIEAVEMLSRLGNKVK